jgi:hypothetical protein
MFNILITAGDFADRFSILKVKLMMIKDPGKLKIVQAQIDTMTTEFVTEYRHLTTKLMDAYEKGLERLYSVNHRLWILENKIRECDANKKFDIVFITTARMIYKANDRRAAIKNNICNVFNQTIHDVKELPDYD